MIIENLSRRDLLRLAAAASVPLVAPRGAWGHSASPIVKPLPPEWFVVHGTNAEMRWEAVPELGHLIPNERFFVRNHTRTPSIDPATWRLTVHGSGVRRPLSLSLHDLERPPVATSCSPAPPTAAASPSRTPCPSTTAATSSGPSSATR